MLSMLIVDDEPAVVETLAYTMEWEQFGIMTVYKAYSAKEALAILEEYAVDLLIADIYMPRMSGLELIKHVRQQYRHVKCVLLSGHAEFEYAQQALKYGVSEYLLKPAADEEILAVIGKLVEQIKSEWEEVISRNRLLSTFKESLPVLRGKLLNELLITGVSNDSLERLLPLYDLPFGFHDDICVMVIRTEESLAEYNERDFHLLDYAILNIASEMFADAYHLWSCRDMNGYLVIVAKKKPDIEETGSGHADSSEVKKFHLLALQLQRNIGLYLKRVVSVVVSRWGCFPRDIQELYRQILGQIRSRLANESGCFLPGDLPEETAVQHPLHRLYETPTLHHLLDSQQWAEYESKLEIVIRQMRETPHLSEEHVREAYTMVSGSFYYYAHKHNRLLSDLVGGSAVLDRAVRSVQQLSEWAGYMLEKIKSNAAAEQRSSKEKLIMKVRDYIDRNLGNASLQTAADAVYLHPVYLSRLYKAETGEGLSEYIHKQRMVKAAALMKDHAVKIYEISESLGYKNAAYFSKIFREEFGMTPQEYRDQL
ncbi:DNA-binding response regulator [Paenibacillus sambharensis]|uniref:DNA-binding response regulator n=1 Tax=Paenibacillus sambharensis TaxID=1803190 RepID=A0A2W1L8P2_9BACL|nr:response regulator [Paenibacillus sambharensis]PZD95283.1 DNA-binding response regulator [Paenibacillus sambharensis]